MDKQRVFNLVEVVAGGVVANTKSHGNRLFIKKHTQERCMTAWLLYDADQAQLWTVAIFVDRRECLVDFQAPSIFEEL